jgi:uncharacterized damage-inducible protein DinB
VTTLDEHGRPEPPLEGDEIATLLGFLDFHRATLAWKCAGLDAAALATRLGPSTMTLGGLLKHLTLVEDGWFRRWVAGEEGQPEWVSEVRQTDRTWDWTSAAADDPADLRERWQDAVERSRAIVAAALERGGLEQHTRRGWPDGRTPTLRWLLVHMIEEYARHNGHADLLREAIDGATGE